MQTGTGKLLAGSLIDTFEAGTTTPKTTYTDEALSVPHANPIVVDADGRWPTIFAADSDTFQLRLRDSGGATIVGLTDDYTGVSEFALSSADVLSALASNSAAVIINGASMTGSAYTAFASALTLTAAGSIDASAGAITLGSVTGPTTFTSALTVSSGSVIVSGDNQGLRTSTSDGSDNQTLNISGGGGFGSDRGALIQLAGNEDASTGILNLASGNVSGGNITLSPKGTTTMTLTSTLATLGVPLTVTEGAIHASTGSNVTGSFLSTDATGFHVFGDSVGTVQFDGSGGIITLRTGGNGGSITGTAAADAVSFDASQNTKIHGDAELDGALNHDGSTVGFYGTSPTAQQTGVAVSAAAVHAALVTLGLITA